MNIYDLHHKWVAWRKQKAQKASFQTTYSDNGQGQQLNNEDHEARPQEEPTTGQTAPVRLNKASVDLIALIQIIIQKWKFVVLTLIAWAVFGIWYAFQQPKEYIATVMLAPETTSNNLTNKISSITSMVGLFNDANPTGDAIYPEVYPDMMSSNDFLVKLFPVKVKTLKGDVSTNFYDYQKNKTKVTTIDKFKEGLMALASKFADKDINKVKSDSLHPNPFQLTKDENGIVNQMKSNFTCQVDKKTSVITISAKTEDPLISATMANAIKDELQKAITNYKTQKSRNDVKYMSELNLEAQKEYTKARQRYAAYCDANIDATLEAIKSKQEDLENDMQLKYNIYTQTVQQLQLAQANLQDNTPAFTTLQSASVPLKHCNTPKIFILATFLLIGALCDFVLLGIKYRKRIVKIA